MATTRQLSRAVLESGVLFRDNTYDLHRLFQIRDACIILKKFGLEDKDLLGETIKYINQKVENEHP